MSVLANQRMRESIREYANARIHGYRRLTVRASS
jgi:hypothetical protein